MNDNIILIILLASAIGSLWIYSKYYYLCKDKERESGEKLLPGGLWYLIFYPCMFSIIFSPISFIMVIYKYIMIKKLIVEDKSDIISHTSNSGISLEQPEVIAEKENQLTDNIESEPIEISSKDLVYYKRNDEIIDCFLGFDNKDSFRVYNSAYSYDYVKKGDVVLYLSNKSYLEKPKRFDIIAEDEGYFVNHSSCIDGIYPGYHLYTIYKSPDVFQKTLFSSIFEVGKDDFTKKNTIKATSHGGNKYGFYIGMLFIRIELFDDKHKLHVDFCSKDLQFTKRNSLHFLLEDGKVLSFCNFTTPVKYTPNSNINMTTSTVLTDEDIYLLATKKMVKWQLINDEGTILHELDFPARIGMDKQVHLIGFRRKVLIDYFSKYLSLYNDIKKDIDVEVDTKQTSSTCYVYLMIDTTNNFHKIGISNHPKYREHTLQSDKPTIELVCAKEYPTRTIAEAIEGALHRAYAAKRIRGEWFNLDSSDIEDVKNTLK